MRICLPWKSWCEQVSAHFFASSVVANSTKPKPRLLPVAGSLMMRVCGATKMICARKQIFEDRHYTVHKL